MTEREDLPMISVPEEVAEQSQAKPVMVRLPVRSPGLVSRGFGKPTTRRRLAPAKPVPTAVEVDEVELVEDEIDMAAAPAPKTRSAAPARPPAAGVEMLQRRLDEQHRMLQDALRFNMQLTKERDELKAGTILLQQEMLKIRREAKMSAAPRNASPQEGNLAAQNEKQKSQVIALERHLKGTLEKLSMVEAARKKAEADRAEMEQRLAAAWVALQPRRAAPAPIPGPIAPRLRPAVRPAR